MNKCTWNDKEAFERIGNLISSNDIYNFKAKFTMLKLLMSLEKNVK